MKRLCFDTESDYHPGSQATGLWDIEDCRNWMCEIVRRLRQPIRFDCGVVYDENANQYHHFVNGEPHSLVALLATADELISQNGKRWDFLILEQVVGRDAIAPLWTKPHHDLLDVIERASIENLAKQYVPCLFDASEGARLARIKEDSGFIAGKLAKARRDVELTYAVFREYEVKGRKSAPPAPDPIALHFIVPSARWY